MTEPLDHHVVAICEEYARLLCAARQAERESREGERYARIMREAARFLTECAPGASGPYLDCIKRILEIDTATTDVNVVLLRASVVGDHPERWEMRTDVPSDPNAGSDLIPVPSFTCRQCGRTSYNPNDIEQRYCGNCKTWETIVP